MTNRMIHTPSYLATATAGEYWHQSAAVITAGWYTNASGQRTFTKFFAAQSGWTIGFRFMYTTGTANVIVVQLYDGATLHADLRFNQSTGCFNVTRNSTVLLTSTTALAASTEYYVEIQFVIADSPSGVAILKVDGVTDSVINSSTLDTRNAGNASADTITFYGTNSAAHQLKDIYINDNAGGVDDTFWGPIAVATLTTSANGTTNNWTPLSSTNVSNVDDASADGDSTYNATSANGDIDLFAMTNTGYASGTVKGVEWVGEMRRTDASATARVAPIYRIGSTNYVRTDILPRTSYRLEAQQDRVSPATSSAWTVSELDGMEAGIKRTAA